MSIRKKNRKRNIEETDINITPFMDLMVALISILILNVSFTHLKAIELTLPELTQSITIHKENLEDSLSLILRDDFLEIRFPFETVLKKIPVKNNDFSDELTDYLYKIKNTFNEENVSIKSSQILIEPQITHQKIVYTVDAIKDPHLVDAKGKVNLTNLTFGDAPLAQGGKL